MQSMRHICSKLITIEQHFCEQIKRGTGHLDDTFIDESSVEQISIVNLYEAGT